jgi:hypothetical protein
VLPLLEEPCSILPQLAVCHLHTAPPLAQPSPLRAELLDATPPAMAGRVRRALAAQVAEAAKAAAAAKSATAPLAHPPAGRGRGRGRGRGKGRMALAPPADGGACQHAASTCARLLSCTQVRAMRGSAPLGAPAAAPRLARKAPLPAPVEAVAAAAPTRGGSSVGSGTTRRGKSHQGGGDNDCWGVQAAVARRQRLKFGRSKVHDWCGAAAY